MKYCNDIYGYSRLRTREIKIGNIVIGGNTDIVIQSMTTTDTLDTEKSVEQIISIYKSNAKLVRLTAPSIKDAENLSKIKQELTKKGNPNIPLVADIHFTPNAAIEAAKHVEKVRINPGNYNDKKKFDVVNLSNQEYNEILNEIEKKLLPFIEICKSNNTAVRIGVNHGSLSDRITSKYGDSPKGMMNSAIEFIEIFRKYDFHDIVISMKSSNPIIMINAYRMISNYFIEKEWDYPLHLGVTEAGDSEDGRIKSAIGIGTLLEDGIGDTIRVSLTERPENEVPVAEKIVNRLKNKTKSINNNLINIENQINSYEYNKRTTFTVENIGSEFHTIVIGKLNNNSIIDYDLLYNYGYLFDTKNNKWIKKFKSIDYLIVNNKEFDFELPKDLKLILPFERWNISDKINKFPIIELDNYFDKLENINKITVFIELNTSDFEMQKLMNLKDHQNVVIILKSNLEYTVKEFRAFFNFMIYNHLKHPIVIQNTYNNIDIEEFMVESAIDNGSLLIDGFGDGIIINSENNKNQELSTKIAFGILQASRTRISQTDYISCPSCGRTLFDLEEVTAKIKKATNHLIGMKIAVMGCIVNGPGEMADADYGYVGSGIGKINLYKKHNLVKKNIDSLNAIDELINLIKDNGDWKEITQKIEM